MDFMHIAFRMRRQFVDAGRHMGLGGHLVDGSSLRTIEAMQATGLTLSDLDPHDKQNYGGCLKLFDFVHHGRNSKVRLLIQQHAVTGVIICVYKQAGFPDMNWAAV